MRTESARGTPGSGADRGPAREVGWHGDPSLLLGELSHGVLGGLVLPLLYIGQLGKVVQAQDYAVGGRPGRGRAVLRE